MLEKFEIENLQVIYGGKSHFDSRRLPSDSDDD